MAWNRWAEEEAEEEAGHCSKEERDWHGVLREEEQEEELCLVAAVVRWWEEPGQVLHVHIWMGVEVGEVLPDPWKAEEEGVEQKTYCYLEIIVIMS